MDKKILGILLLSLTMVVGCADEKKSGGNDDPPVVDIPDDGPYVPPGSGPGLAPDGDYGASAPLEIVGDTLEEEMNVFTEYTTEPRNDPQEIQVNLNLERHGNGYGGTVTITYKDNGQYYEGYFTSGHSEKSNKYNRWFVKDGQQVWHGFFEDYIGAIVVVIDRTLDLGDGGGPQEDQAGGSIWFKNFEPTYAPHPPTYCWFVSLGPYDCRAWKSGEGVDTTRAVNPDSGYKKLGDFDGLDIEKAFNGSIDL